MAINKIQRFGMGNHHPEKSINNLDALRYEIVDVQQCITELEKRSISLKKWKEKQNERRR